MLYTITGANGFIACSLVKHLVSLGHTVRGTVRDATKDGEYLKSLGASVIEVKDLSDVDALASAFKGCDGIFHMAAVHPEYGFAETPEGRAGILATAVEGTVSVLSAAKKANIKRVVLTCARTHAHPLSTCAEKSSHSDTSRTAHPGRRWRLSSAATMRAP